MKKIIATSVATVLPLLAGVTPAFAQDYSGPGSDWLSTIGEGSGLNTDMDLPTFIGQIIYVILSFLGIIFLAFVLYAGFLWMTAGGDAKNVDKAKTLLLQAVIGLVIILAAYAITSFVMGTIGGAIATS